MGKGNGSRAALLVLQLQQFEALRASRFYPNSDKQVVLMLTPLIGQHGQLRFFCGDGAMGQLRAMKDQHEIAFGSPIPPVRGFHLVDDWPMLRSRSR